MACELVHVDLSLRSEGERLAGEDQAPQLRLPSEEEVVDDGEHPEASSHSGSGQEGGGPLAVSVTSEVKVLDGDMSPPVVVHLDEGALAKTEPDDDVSEERGPPHGVVAIDVHQGNVDLPQGDRQVPVALELLALEEPSEVRVARLKLGVVPSPVGEQSPEGLIDVPPAPEGEVRHALEPEEVVHPRLLDLVLGRGVVSDESDHEVSAEVTEEARAVGRAVHELIGETCWRLKRH